ncbi:MAG: hypothetical protein HQL41_04335 [Alphaproteobacteria bacterium]|nr:hypothetical protein [Alphaproteobacteria bacterium]
MRKIADGRVADIAPPELVALSLLDDLAVFIDATLAKHSGKSELGRRRRWSMSAGRSSRS